MLGVQALERLLEGRQAEEVVLLRFPAQLDLVDRAAVAVENLVLHLEVGAARAVPALVQALVDVAVVVGALQHLLDLALVLLIGGADEEVVGDAELGHQRLETLGVAVGELLRLEPLGMGGVGDRFAVLVGAGQEEDVLPTLAHVPGEHVGGDRRVRVAEVRLRIDVVDGGRDVERHRTAAA